MTIAPNSTTDLTTLSDVEAWLGALSITIVAADQLQIMVTAMSASIQSWLGYNLLQQTYDVAFDGRGVSKVAFPNSPVTAVSALSIDGQSIPQAPDQKSCGYVYSTVQGQSWLGLRGYRFFRGMQNCSISYTAGFTAGSIPPALVQACRESITALTQVTGREPGLIREKVGGLEEAYAAPSAGTNVLDGFVLTPTITLALTPLRRVVPAW